MHRLLLCILGLMFLLGLLFSFFVYEPNKPFFAQGNKVKMRISIILVKTRPEAQRILKDLDAGVTFAGLASRFSIGPGKEEGGDVGSFAPGDMQEELNSVAVNLKIGEYSRIIETDKGYFILMRTEEKSSSELVTAQAQETLWKELTAKSTELHQQGRYSEAESVARKALEVGEKTFGLEHPDVALSLNNLAGLYHVQGKYAEAEPLYKRSLAIVEKALGLEHPHVVQILENYAALLRKTKRHTEAAKMEARAMATRVKHAQQNPTK